MVFDPKLDEFDEKFINSLRDELFKKCKDKRVGAEDVVNACAAVMAYTLKDAISHDFSFEAVNILMETLGIFSARVLHELFTKNKED